jgi:hypothetical protein
VFDFKPWIDQYGLVCQRDPISGQLDGGDSPMKTSFYYMGLALTETPFITTLNAPRRDQFLMVIKNIRNKEGQYFRNPVKYTEPKDMSRDQEFPLLCAMETLGAFDYSNQIRKAWITNVNRAQNDDLIGPDVWVAYFSLARFRALYAIFVLFGDLVLLLGVIIRCIKARDPDDVGDDMNLSLQLIMRARGYGSPLSCLARHLYIYLRPYSYGSYFEDRFGTQVDQSDQTVKDNFERDRHHRNSPKEPAVIGAWKWYWRKTTGAPPMYDLWAPILKKYLT